MGRTREILRQKWLLERSHREVAASVGVSAGVVGKTMSRAQRHGLTWAAVELLDDRALEVKLYGSGGAAGEERPQPDCVWIHVERKKPGVTLELLHIEYLERHPTGLRYTQFCNRYRDWLDKQRISMRQVHRAGEKGFVDFGGKKPRITDRRTGAQTEVEIFVGVLGASNYTFAVATPTQKGPDWIRAHVEMFQFFGGVPAALVPDQLKSAVTKSCRYEPEIQRTYEEMAEHYDTVVFPARPAKPRDKAKVEVGVQVVTRWILARIRNETFFSIEALNERIGELLEELNDRVMRRYGRSRRQLFEAIDRPALKPLPKERFEYGEWLTATVNIDYHVEVKKHFYSVPYTYRREAVDVRVGASLVEISLNRVLIAVHKRDDRPGQYSTKSEHMPKSHREHLEWTPSRIIHWAGTIGPNTAELVKAIMEERPHPEMGYRSSLGIIRLEKSYGKERLERACVRALAVRARSYRHVAAILKNGMDQLPPEPETATQLAIADAGQLADSNASQPADRFLDHENIRGPGYYH